MNGHRTYARFAGAMFLLAIVTSITGGLLIQGAIDQPVDLGSNASDRWAIRVGATLELINAVAVIGIAASLWVPLKERHPGMTIGYVGLRIIESGLCVAAAFIPVTLLAIGESDDQQAMSAGPMIMIRADLVEHGVPIFLGLGSLILYLILHRTRLVPRYIAIWGLVAAPAVIVANTVLAGTAVAPVLVAPILANEIYLGIYLMAKGLNRSTRPGPKIPHRMSSRP